MALMQEQDYMDLRPSRQTMEHLEPPLFEQDLPGNSLRLAPPQPSHTLAGLPLEQQAILQQIQSNLVASQPKKQSTFGRIAKDIGMGLLFGPAGIIGAEMGSSQRQQRQQTQANENYARALQALANLQQQSLPYYERPSSANIAAGEMQNVADMTGNTSIARMSDLARENPYADPKVYQSMAERYPRGVVADTMGTNLLALQNQGVANEVPILNQLSKQPLQQGYASPQVGFNNPAGPFAPLPGMKGQKAGKLFDKDFPVTSPFGAQRVGYTHEGVDYGAPVGTQAKLPFDATFLRTFNDKKGGGTVSEFETLGLDGKKYTMQYLHGADQGKLGLKAGQVLPQGAAAFFTGNSGRSTGPHLDFRIKGPDGKRVDPNKFLNMQMMALGSLDPARPALQFSENTAQPFAANVTEQPPIQLQESLAGLPLDESALNTYVAQIGQTARDMKTPTDIYSVVSQARGRETQGVKELTDAQATPTRVAIDSQQAQTAIDKLNQDDAQFQRSAGQKDRELGLRGREVAVKESAGGEQGKAELSAIESQLRANDQQITNLEKAGDKAQAQVLRNNSTRLINRMNEIRQSISGTVANAGQARIAPRQAAIPSFRAAMKGG